MQRVAEGTPTGRTASGVNANASKKHLLDVARRPDVSGPLVDEQGRTRLGHREGQRRETSRNR